MRKTEIQFSDHYAQCVFLDNREQLPQALRELNLQGGYPVIVLVGGFIQDQYLEVTQKAIEGIAALAEENCAVIICGGSNLGIMASIGQTRAARQYTFPLLGINLENLVTWPNGPRGRGFFWWREERISLAPGYSHFILVPGDAYGEDSPWIADAATYLAKGYQSVTILANGGRVSRKDVALSLENDRPVIVLAGTGRLADEMANQIGTPTTMMIVQARDETALRHAVRLAISTSKESTK